MPTPAGLKWHLLFLAVLAGSAGAWFWGGIHHPKWFLGAAFQAASLWLLWSAFPALPAPPPPPLTPSLPIPQREPFSRRAFFLVPLALGAFGQILFLNLRLVEGLLLWAGALLLLGWLLLKGRLPSSPFDPSPRTERLLLGFILLAAALTRFPFVGDNLGGLQIDEANNIEDSIRAMRNQLPSPFTVGWGANPSFTYFLLGLFMKIAGPSVEAARVFAAFCSLVALLYFHRWCRFYFRAPASLAATFLMSIGHCYYYFSLSPFHDIFLAAFEILALYFLEKGFRAGGKAPFLWAGLFTSMALMTYISGRLLILIIGLALLGHGLVRGLDFWRRNWRGLLLAFGSFLWLSGPFIFYIIDPQSHFFSRSKELSLFNEIARTGDWSLLPGRIGWTLASFVYPGVNFDDRFAVKDTPLLDPLTGLFMVCGILTALLNLRRRWAWLVLSGALFGVAANALAIQGQNPDLRYVNALRFFLILPFLMAAAAAFLDRLPAAWAALKAPRPLLPWLLGSLAAFSLAWNTWYFLFDPQAPRHVGSRTNFVRTAELVREYHPRAHLMVHWNLYDSPVRVLVPGIPVKSFGHWSLPFPFRAEKDVVILFQPRLEILGDLQKHYPAGTLREIRDYHKGVETRVYEIPLDQFRAAQKDLALTESLP